MAWKIEFKATAAEKFERLDGSVKNQISKYLKKIEERKKSQKSGRAALCQLGILLEIQSRRLSSGS